MWPCSGEAGLNCGAGGSLNVKTISTFRGFCVLYHQNTFSECMCIVLKLQKIFGCCFFFLTLSTSIFQLKQKAQDVILKHGHLKTEKIIRQRN